MSGGKKKVNELIEKKESLSCELRRRTASRKEHVERAVGKRGYYQRSFLFIR